MFAMAIVIADRVAETIMQPLAGKRIIITRTAAQASDLLQRLTALGAEAISLPTIEIAPPASWAPLDSALARWRLYDGTIFTSVNGVVATFARAEGTGVA